jgi:DNA topoisomerase IB
METVIINGTEYGFFGKSRGSNTSKFNRVVKLARMFESLDEKLDGFIVRGNYCSEQARLALGLKLMMWTGIRIGNEGSAEGYITKPHPNSKAEPMFVQTYGLTTLKVEHVSFTSRSGSLYFLGKKQVENSFKVYGELCRQLRKVAKDRVGEDTLFGITDYQLSKFVGKTVGKQFTPKDFRTLKANMVAWDKLQSVMEREVPSTKRELNAEVREIAEEVSNHLNNTVGVCKKSYIDERIWEYFTTERLNG